MRRISFERAKSIAGVVLVSAGTVILFDHMDRAAAGLGHVFAVPGGTLGVGPAVIFAASRIVRALAAGQRRFLQDFVEQLVISSWPLILVMVGAVLSRDCVGHRGEAISKKIAKVSISPAAVRR